MMWYGIIEIKNEASTEEIPGGKVHWANMGPVWGQQGPGWPHFGPMNLVIWVYGIVGINKT